MLHVPIALQSTLFRVTIVVLLLGTEVQRRHHLTIAVSYYGCILAGYSVETIHRLCMPYSNSAVAS